MGKTLSAIRIDKPGLLTTVQDQGRVGLLHMALSRAGAMDRQQLAIANLLIGNDEADAGLELTGMGPTIFFPQETAIAFAGAWIDAVLTSSNGATCRVSPGRPVIVPPHSSIRWPAPAAGFRAWLAIAGGIEIPQILGSRASHLAAEVSLPRIAEPTTLALGLSSVSATARLKACLLAESNSHTPNQGESTTVLTTRWSVPSGVPKTWPIIELAALPGRHFDWLSDADKKQLLTQAWQVSSRSNRQGLALEGQALHTAGFVNLDSEPVREGTVQLPSAGKPFVLLAEHQSTGGYPRILEVVGGMERELAQAGPSARVIFKLVDLQQADALRSNRAAEMLQLRQAVRSKLMGL
ncbi:biotin-dependent carboxyltransferase family protein [beta proteobacterium MWH-UniP1]